VSFFFPDYVRFHLDVVTFKANLVVHPVAFELSVPFVAFLALNALRSFRFSHKPSLGNKTVAVNTVLTHG